MYEAYDKWKNLKVPDNPRQMRVLPKHRTAKKTKKTEKTEDHARSDRGSSVFLSQAEVCLLILPSLP